MMRRTVAVLVALVALQGCDFLKTIDDAVNGSPCEGSDSWPRVRQVWASTTVAIEGTMDGTEAIYRAKEKIREEGRSCTSTQLTTRSPFDAKVVKGYLLPLHDKEMHYDIEVTYEEQVFQKPSSPGVPPTARLDRRDRTPRREVAELRVWPPLIALLSPDLDQLPGTVTHAQVHIGQSAALQAVEVLHQPVPFRVVYLDAEVLDSN